MRSLLAQRRTWSLVWLVVLTVAVMGVGSWVSAPSRAEESGVGQRPHVISVMNPPPKVLEDITAGRIPGFTLDSLRAVEARAAALRSEQRALTPLPDAGPLPAVTGTRNPITVLGDYTNRTHNGVSTPTLFNNMLFSVGTYPTGSLRDYYRQNSYNLLDTVGTVDSAWRGVGKATNQYANCDGTPDTNDDYGLGSYPCNVQSFVRDLVLAADPYVNFSQFAVGGVVRDLWLIHAGQGADANQSCYDCLWSVSWGLGSHSVTVDGVTVDGFIVMPEYVYSPGDSTFGVFAHEYGHGLGLPDLYDYDYSSWGVGNWSLMAFGSWSGSPAGSSPSHLDAWSKSELGWITPTTPAFPAPGTSIANAEQNPVAYRIPVVGPATEYFIVENRQLVGFDANLPGSGLLIYHIDELADQTNDWHPMVMVEQADGNWDLQYRNNGGDTGDPWPGSTSNRCLNNDSTPNSRTYSGAASGASVCNISNSAMVMTADLNGGAVVRPPNDDFADAIVVGSLPFVHSEDTTGASAEPGEVTPPPGSGCSTNMDTTVWYNFTPGVAAEIVTDTFGSNYDTQLIVWSGPDPATFDDLTFVGCNDDTGGLQSQVSFTAAAGVSYYFQIDSYSGATADLVFNVQGETPPVDLVITKSASPADGSNVTQGATITYTLTVSNSAGATGTATAVPVRDTFESPLEVSLTSVSATAPDSCADTSLPEINCTIDSLSPGQSRTITVMVTATAAAGATVLNGAYVDPTNAIAEANEDADDSALDCTAVGEVPGGATEPDNFDCTSHTVGPEGPVVSIDPPSQEVSEGSFDVLVKEGVDVAGVAYTVDFNPSIIEVDSRTPGSFPPGCNVQIDTIVGHIEFACITTPLNGADAPGVVATYNFHCLVDEGSTLLDLEDELVDSSANPITPVTVEDGWIHCQSNADVTITKTDSPDPVGPLGALTYTLQPQNLGPGQAQDVVVTDDLPPEVTFISVSPGSPTCSHGGSLTGGTVTCNLGSLPVGPGPAITIQVQTIMTPVDVQVVLNDPPNWARIDASNEEPEDEDNNDSSAATTVLGRCPDVNPQPQDYYVSLPDLAKVAQHWHHNVCPPDDDWDDYLDMNRDCSIGLVDLAKVALHWHQTCTPETAPPWPGP